ncbi:MAG: ketoacyl-ACP synthase III [Planctomycetes bacterium]|nr:ketoacyl-ACP synthase III [Planctomycetota bacterium]
MPAPNSPKSPSPNPQTRAVGILGLGACMPDKVVTNHDMEKIVETSDDWIRQRTGIEQRRIALPTEACSDIAGRAAERALANANCNASELDLIIVGTVSGDHPFPATATLIQARLGAWNAAAFDISAACPGFIYATSIGSQFIATGKYRRVLVIGAEILSRLLDFKDRTTCVIFGDGAGAAVLAPFEETKKAEIVEFDLYSKGGDPQLLWMPAGGSRLPATHETVEERKHYIKMAGREVYRFAVESMVAMVRKAVDKYGKDEIALVIPHQMNRRIIESIIERVELDPARVFINIEKYGNTSAASVPVALAEAVAQGRAVPGKLVMLCAVGAGFTWGSIVIRW